MRWILFILLTQSILFGESVDWGSDTPAGAGGWQPLDGGNNPITLSSVTGSSGMGSYTPSIDVNGRLVFDLVGAPDSGSVTVEDASANSYTAEITELSSTRSVATWTEAHSAINAISTSTGGTVLFRPWAFDTSTGAGEEIRKNVTFTTPLVLKGEKDHLSTLNNGIILRNIAGVTLENLNIEDTSGVKGAIVNLTGDCDDITINDCWIHGVYRDPTADYSSGNYSNSDAAIKSVASGNGYTVGVTVTNSKLYNVSTATTFIMSSTETGFLSVTDNEVYNIYADGIKFVPGASGIEHTYNIERNVIYSFIGDPSDVGNPHVDVIQMVSNGNYEVPNIVVRQNVAWADPQARGKSIQGITSFEDSGFRNIWKDPIINGNVMVIDGNHHLTVRASGGYVVNNTLLGPDPSNIESPAYSDGTKTIRLEGSTSGSASEGGVLVHENITETGLSANSQIGNTVTDNLALGVDGATYSYASVLDGTDWTNSTLALTLSAFSIKSGGQASLTGDGAGAIGSGYGTYGSARDSSGWSYDAARDVGEVAQTPFIRKSRSIQFRGVLLTF